MREQNLTLIKGESKKFLDMSKEWVGSYIRRFGWATRATS